MLMTSMSGKSIAIVPSENVEWQDDPCWMVKANQSNDTDSTCSLTELDLLEQEQEDVFEIPTTPPPLVTPSPWRKRMDNSDDVALCTFDNERMRHRKHVDSPAFSKIPSILDTCQFSITKKRKLPIKVANAMEGPQFFILMLLTLAVVTTLLSVHWIGLASPYSTRFELKTYIRQYTLSHLPSTFSSSEYRILEHFAKTAHKSVSITDVALASSSPLQDVFTVRLRFDSSSVSFTPLARRLDSLIQSLTHITACPRVHEVQVQFQGDAQTFPKGVLQHTSGKVVTINNEDSTDPKLTPQTDSVLLLDEQQMFTFSCFDLDRAFATWKQNPLQMVGFFPLRFYSQNGQNSALAKTRGDGSYNLVSSSAAFVHRMYLKSPKPRGTRCDDVALSIQISAFTLQPPIGVLTRIKSGPSKPLLRRMHHEEALHRQESIECVQTLLSLFHVQDLPMEHVTFLGNLPLAETARKAAIK